MKILATTLCAAMLLVFGALPAEAQRGICDTMQNVTIDQINAIPQANIDQLNALGAQATAQQIHALLTNEWDNPNTPNPEFRCVRVQAVVLTDPRYSGLSSWVGPPVDLPGRIHLFIRDTSAETAGPEGMTIMVVDDTQTGLVMPLRPGDVIELEGYLNIFGNPPERAWQLTPLDGEAIDVLGTVDPDLPWLQPVTVSTSDINMAVAGSGGDTTVQANWSNWNSFNGQYVRIEGAVITQSEQSDRPNWAFASFGEDERVANRDVSLRYRNDRHSTYPPPPAFFTRPADDPFIAPPPGAVVDVQGFINFGTFDAFNIGQPPRAKFFINPITDDDLVLTTSPPLISVEPLEAVPTGPFQVFATVVSGTGDPITSITLDYEFTSGASGSVNMTATSGDNRFVGTIPAGAPEDGAFVAYSVTATDSGGLENTSATLRTRVLLGGITQIEHIQRTWNGGPGQGPFAGMTTEMQIEGVVMTDPSIPDIITIQDDADLNPWTGIYLIYTEALATQLQEGDIIQITEATIHDGPGTPAFNMTRLAVSMDNITVVGSQSPYAYVEGFTTADFQNSSLAESYEGMAVRFDDVVVTARNADGDAPFGEFAFSSDGTTANQFRARTGTFDASSALPPGHTMFHEGHMIEYIQGIMAFTHGNYKLLPQTMDDFGQVTSSDTDGNAQQVTLDAAYPNPVTSRATITYALAQSGHVRVEVFDITGRRVAMLVDAEQAAGSQEVSLDATSMASGMYLIRLAADGAVQTTRVIVTH